MLSRNQKTSDDVARLRNGLNIRRPRKKSNMLNDKRIKSCIARFTNGSYSRLQFLRAGGILSARIRTHYSRGTTAAARTTTRTTSVRRNASSDNISGVRISSGASCSNLRRQLRSLPRGATCWLHTGAVRTRAVLQIVRNRKSLFPADKTLHNSNI